MGILYLIQPAELVGTDRYKIGCSDKNDLSRLNSYKKNTKRLCIIKCTLPFIFEKILKIIFNLKFKKIAGHEYFRGNEKIMLFYFTKISNYIETNNYNDDNNLSVKIDVNVIYEHFLKNNENILNIYPSYVLTESIQEMFKIEYVQDICNIESNQEIEVCKIKNNTMLFSNKLLNMFFKPELINTINKYIFPKNLDLGLICKYGIIELLLLTFSQSNIRNNYYEIYNTCIDNACIGGYEVIVKLVIKYWENYLVEELCDVCKTGNIIWNNGLISACKYGNTEIATLMIDNGADDYKSGIFHAYTGLYNDPVNFQTTRLAIIKFMLEYIEIEWTNNIYYACIKETVEYIESIIKNESGCFNNIYNTACNDKKIDIIKLVIQKELHNWNVIYDNSFLSRDLEIVKLIVQEKQNIINVRAAYACKKGLFDIVKLLIKKGANDWNKLLAIASQCGHLNIVNLIITKGVINWDMGLFGACKGGQLELVKFMIKNGADNWKMGLYYACYGGQLEIINLMINKGVDDWDIGMCGACYGGQLEIIKSMIDKGANKWNNGLSNACEGGKLEIVNFMIDKGANNWNDGLIGACSGGHEKFVNLMIEKGAYKWNEGLSGACYNEQLEIVKLMIEKGATHCSNCNNHVFN
jgi:ankyrin repeat protein